MGFDLSAIQSCVVYFEFGLFPQFVTFFVWKAPLITQWSILLTNSANSECNNIKQKLGRNFVVRGGTKSCMGREQFFSTLAGQHSMRGDSLLMGESPPMLGSPEGGEGGGDRLSWAWSYGLLGAELENFLFKIFFPKKFWSKRYFSPKKFGPNKMLLQKFFVPKNFAP